MNNKGWIPDEFNKHPASVDGISYIRKEL